MRRQDWAQALSVLSLCGGVAELARRRPTRAAALLATAAAADAAGRIWSRQRPAPFPAAMRWLLEVPQRGGPPARLERILDAQPGERMLEIGPGTGQTAIRVARSVAPGGRVDVLDVQQEMLGAVTRRAARHNVTNLTATLGDGGNRLPYASESFDGAYLMSVLGEIPDREQALAELFRVLRPGGRLVIGEIIVDPDYVSPGRLKQLARAAGFRLYHRSGSPLAYAARLSR